MNEEQMARLFSLSVRHEAALESMKNMTEWFDNNWPNVLKLVKLADSKGITSADVTIEDPKDKVDKLKHVLSLEKQVSK